MSESTLQQIVIQMIKDYYPEIIINLSLNGIQLFGTPKQKAQTISGMRKQGMVKGIADFQLIVPNGKVINIELKKPGGGVQSDEQKAMQRKLKTLGHNYYLCDSKECVLQAIIENTPQSWREQQCNKTLDDEELMLDIESWYDNLQLDVPIEEYVILKYGLNRFNKIVY